jgi:hypothetical protein
MPLDFPDAPVIDQEYTAPEGGRSWTWDGVSWVLTPTAATLDEVDEHRVEVPAHGAYQIAYSNLSSGLTATDAQGAIDELVTDSAAADATKVAKTGDTMTGPLTISTQYPFVALNSSTAGEQLIEFREAGVRRVRIWRSDGSDALYVSVYDAAGTVIRHAMAVFGDGSLDFSTAPVMWVPAISGPSQAAQVTAYDATTSRLAIGGREIGDTGWRTLVTWTAAGALTKGTLGADFVPVAGVAGSIQVRRVGAQVWMAITALASAGAWTAGSYRPLFGGTDRLPLGFRPSAGCLVAFALGASTASGAAIPHAALQDIGGAPTRFYVHEATSGPIRVGETVPSLYGPWITDEAWPTTLP